MRASRHRLASRTLVLATVCIMTTAWSGAIAHAQEAPSGDPVPVTAVPTEPKVHPPGDVDPQIVGGLPAPIGNFPFMGALLRSSVEDPFNAQFCGGTLIDPSWVLTAAHCLAPPDYPVGQPVPADFQIAFGHSDLDTIAPGDRLAFDQIVMSPSYQPVTAEFDFALMHLSVPEIGRPTAAFQVQNDVPLNTQGIFLGWGSDPTQGFSTTDLNYGIAKVLGAPSTTSCGSWGTSFHSTSQLCIGQSATGGQPARCTGDDGGPFVVGNPGGYTIVGVVSLGPLPCGNANPDVYARMSSAAGWVQETLAPPGSTGTYHALDPIRIVDTRFDVGSLAISPVGPSDTINPQITGMFSPAGVPVTGSPTAVVVNITATSPSRDGWLTAYPTGAPLPNVSNVNYLAGQTVPNLATVKLGQGGKISINNSGGNPNGGSVQVIVDLVGWYGADATAGHFYDVAAPLRIVDTRFGTIANPTLTDPVDTTTNLQPVVCGGDTSIAADAVAVVINLTAVAGDTAGWATAWPMGVPPTVSNLNYVPGQATGHMAVVKVGPACSILVGNSPGTTTARAPINIVIDVIGWYGPDGVSAGGGLQFHTMVPNRIVDTRFGAPANPDAVGVMSPGETLQVIAKAGSTGLPSTAVSLLTNLTATGGNRYGWLTLHPENELPLVSNLNFNTNETIPNLGIVRIGADGRVRVTNTGNPGPPVVNAPSVNAIMDAVGWFE